MVNAVLVWLLLRALGMRAAWAGGRSFRAAPGPGRVGRLDQRTEERPLHLSVPALGPAYLHARGLVGPPRTRLRAEMLYVLGCWRRAGDVEQDDGLHAARGLGARSVVATRQPAMARDLAARAFLRDCPGPRVCDMGGRIPLFGPENVELHLSVGGRTLVAGRALWFYAFTLLWPTHLVFMYPRWEIKTRRPGGSTCIRRALLLIVILFSFATDWQSPLVRSVLLRWNARAGPGFITFSYIATRL